MSKSTSKFICGNCGFTSSRWLGKCPNCDSFSTMSEELVAVEKKSKSAPVERSISSLTPQAVKNILPLNVARTSSGIAELDMVLGGGIVPASLTLIGGDPGIGKSTVITQVVGGLSDRFDCLYVSAEESAGQVKLRCDRLGLHDCNMDIINETELELIEQLLLNKHYDFVVIDSIQAIYLSAMTSASGSVSQVRECANRIMRLGKSQNITIFIIGHVTKEGTIAGPKVLEHIMDTVLYFEGDATSTFKILRAVKNRFGSTNEVGIFDMTDSGILPVANPSEILLSTNRGACAGTAVTPVVEGSRCMLVEVQALTAPTIFGMPRRMANGIDYNKYILLLAVLEKKAGLVLSNQDAYLSVMGGLRIDEPSVDLAVLAATISATKNQPLPASLALFGEVGLTGEVRAVRDADKRVSECLKLGFDQIVLPEYNLKQLKPAQKSQAKLIGLRFVWQLRKLVFDE